MIRSVVNVATDSWVRGQNRLRKGLGDMNANPVDMRFWTDALPKGCPPHRDRGKLAAPIEQCVPYAFKAYAMLQAANFGADLLLWCDACIVPVSSMEPLWERIERDGYWFAPNGYTNYQWTADAAYPDLFFGQELDIARVKNRAIPHLCATAFGLNVRKPIGRGFLVEYYRHASMTKAFCGPWQNTNAPMVEGRNSDRYAAPCGPPDVLGHRHDQTVASVIAWGFDMQLTPGILSYPSNQMESTILLADGNYNRTHART